MRARGCGVAYCAAASSSLAPTAGYTKDTRSSVIKEYCFVLSEVTFIASLENIALRFLKLVKGILDMILSYNSLITRSATCVATFTYFPSLGISERKSRPSSSVE